MSAPTITITKYTRTKISNKPGYDVCSVSFKANQDLIEWEARADGYAVNTGSLVGNAIGKRSKRANIISGVKRYGVVVASSSSGSSVSIVLKKDSITTFDIEDNELTSGNKSYRITIYGKNINDEWSSY